MSAVPSASERDLWIAELDLLGNTDSMARGAQFAIRTAVRAQELAKLAGTDAVDELLDAREEVSTAATRQVFERAVYYVRADRSLSRDMRDLGLSDSFGL